MEKKRRRKNGEPLFQKKNRNGNRYFFLFSFLEWKKNCEE